MRFSSRTVDYDGLWLRPPTPAVKWLLLINCGVFGLQLLFKALHNASFEGVFCLESTVWTKLSLWQFVTYMFLHADPFHILFNLITLYFFGVEVESAIGSKRFVRLYLLGGLAGGLVWSMFTFGGTAVVVGASGALYAVLIAFATLFPDRIITLLLFFVLPVTMPARYLAVGLVAFSIFFSIAGGSDIAHLAHLGGAAAGYIFVKWLRNGWSGWPRFHWPWSRSRSPPLRVMPAPLRKDEFMRKRIDPILDKIAERGINSLTPEERRLLEEAKDRLS